MFSLLTLVAFAQTAAPPGSAQAPNEAQWPKSRVAIERVAQEAEVAAQRRSPLALARLYRLWNMRALVGEWDVAEKSLRTIAASKRTDPLTAAHAAHLLGEIELRAGRRAEAIAARKGIGLIDAGWLIGPFENSAGSGHDTSYPPEAGVELDGVYPGKGHLARWRNVEGLAPYGSIPVSSLIAPALDATAYLAIAIVAERKTQVALRLGASDRTKVLTAGTVLHAADALRGGELDQDTIALDVPKGTHTLLIKTSWDNGPARILARLTALDGSPARFAKLSGKREDIEAGRQSGVTKSTRRPVHVTDSMERTIARKRDATHLALRSDLFALLGQFDRRKLPTPAVADLEAAIELNPADPMLRFFVAHRIGSLDRALARRHLEAGVQADPRHAPCLLKLAQLEQSAGQSLSARALLERAVAADPTFYRAQLAYAALRFESEFERHAAVSALSASPPAATSSEIQGELARMKKVLRDPIGARKAAHAALKLDHTHTSARDLLIDTAVARSDLIAATRWIKAALEVRPWRWRFSYQLAQVLAGDSTAEGRAAAKETLERASVRFPDEPALLDLRAELELLDSNKDKAIALIESSLALEPNRPKIRQHKTAIAGGGTELEDEFTLDARTLLTLPVTDDEKNWGAAYLLDRTAIELYDNGQSTEFHQFVIRVHRQELAEQLRSQRVHYSPSREMVEILSAERITKDGRVIKAGRIRDNAPRGKVSGMYIDSRWKNISLNGLEQGDLVHIRYRRDSVGSNMFGGFFGSIAAFQGRLPKRNIDYVARAPASRKLYWSGLRIPDPKVTETDGTQITEWHFDTLPPLDMEPAAPPYTEIGMLASISTYANWADLGKWYSGLFRQQMELDDTTREAGRNAVKGVQDEAEKIRRLYNYVVKNTRYVGIELGIHGWKPFKASEVHRRRYGDCKDKATLLAALLRDNGIDATLALVRTVDRGWMPDNHATMWAFNHAITYVPSANLFLDGTAEFSGSQELPYLDQEAMILVVHPDGRTNLTRAPASAAQDNRNESKYIATLDAQGGLTLAGTETYYGARASSLRRRYEEPKTRSNKLEKQLNAAIPGSKVVKVAFKSLDDLEAPPSYSHTTRVARYGERSQGQITLPISVFRHRVSKAYAALPSRKQDLYLSFPWTTTNTVEYVLPKGAKVSDLPKSVTVDSPHIHLEQTVRKTARGFETVDTLTLKSRRIKAADYPAFREACLDIDRALERKVVIGLGGRS